MAGKRQRRSLGAPPGPWTVQLGYGGKGSSPYTLTPWQQQHYFPRQGQVPRDIGCGQHACVYPLPDGKRVVKFTYDFTDAYASERVRTRYPHGNRNLVRIHEVAQLGDEVFGPWAIVATRVAPIPELLERRRACAASVSGTRAMSHAEVREKCFSAADRCMPAYGGDIRWYCSYYGQTVRAYKALLAAGVDWFDAKLANWGMHRGKWVVLDFGSSRVGRPPGGIQVLRGARRRR